MSKNHTCTSLFKRPWVNTKWSSDRWTYRLLHSRSVMSACTCLQAKPITLDLLQWSTGLIFDKYIPCCQAISHPYTRLTTMRPWPERLTNWQIDLGWPYSGHTVSRIRDIRVFVTRFENMYYVTMFFPYMSFRPSVRFVYLCLSVVTYHCWEMDTQLYLVCHFNFTFIPDKAIFKHQLAH